MARILDLADGFSSATAPDLGAVVEQISIAILNNTTASVTGLLLDSSLTIHAEITYHAYREDSLNPRLTQSGKLIAQFDGTDWIMNEAYIAGDDAELSFSITTLGQVQYTSSNFTGISYASELNIRAETLEVI